MIKKSTIVFLILAVVVGTAVRTYGLGRITLRYRESITLLHISGHYLSRSVNSVTRLSELGALDWQDLIDKYQKSGEYFSQVARVINVDQPDRPPGFYQALYLWAQNFGDEPYVLRLLPVLCGVICLPAMFWFAFELFEERAPAYIATTMLCLSPLHICFSQDLAEYSMFTLFFSLSCAAFLRAWRQGGLNNWWIYFGSIVVGTYCSYLMLLVLCAQMLWSLSGLMRIFQKRQRFPRLYINRRIVHSAIALVSLAVLSPVLSNLICNMDQVQRSYSWITQSVPQFALTNAWLYSALFSWTYRPAMTFAFWTNSPFESLFWYHIAVHAILFAAICSMMIGARRQLGFLASTLIVFIAATWLPDAILGGQRSIAIQFFLPVPTIAILPVSYMLSQMWCHSNVWCRVIATVCFVFLLSCELLEDDYMARNPLREPVGTSINKVAALINGNPEYPVIVDLEQHPSLFAYSLALGRFVDGSRQIVFVQKRLPRWIKHYYNAYILHFDNGLKEKYGRFKIKWFSRRCGVAQISRSGGQPKSPRPSKTDQQSEKIKSFWELWLQLDN